MLCPPAVRCPIAGQNSPAPHQAQPQPPSITQNPPRKIRIDKYGRHVKATFTIRIQNYNIVDMWHSIEKILEDGWTLVGHGRLLDLTYASELDFSDLEDKMFQIERENGGHILVVSWFPEGDPKGRYHASHTTAIPLSVRSELMTRDYLIVKRWLSSTMKRINESPDPYPDPMVSSS